MGNRRHVFNRADVQAGDLKRSDRSLAALTGAFDIDLDRFQTVLHCGLGSGLGSHLRGKRVDLREPLYPSPPADAQESAFPAVSVIVTIVLLKLELICAAPRSTFLRSRRFFVTTFFCIFAIRVSLPYFFLLAMVLTGPFLVRALVLVRCPLTGRPFLWRWPR